MLENDDDYKPEMAFGPLEKPKPFHEYNIQKGVVSIDIKLLFQISFVCSFPPLQYWKISNAISL